MAGAPTIAGAAPEASGRAFLGIINHIKQAYGQPELTKAISEAPETTRRVFGNRILHSGYYPYEAFAGFLTALQGRFGKGDPQYGRKLGAASGKQDINTVFRIYLALASSERLIRGCTRVWASYYRNAGQMEAIAWAPEKTTLRITGFPKMAPIHCQLMEGWMITTMDALGLQVHDDGRETRCTSRGDAFHEFSCTWSKKR